MSRLMTFSPADQSGGHGHQIFGSNNFINHPAFQGGFGRQGAGAEYYIERPGQTDESWQTGRTTPRRQQAKLGFRQADFRGAIRGGHAVVTGEAEFVTAAQSSAVNGGHSRYWQGREAVHHRLAQLDQLAHLLART